MDPNYEHIAARAPPSIQEVLSKINTIGEFPLSLFLTPTLDYPSSRNPFGDPLLLHAETYAAPIVSRREPVADCARAVVSYIYDVAIIDVTASATDVVSGQVVSVTVVVKNNGTVTETFNVTLFCDETAIETKTVTDLAPGNQRTLRFEMNTTGLPEGNFRISAEANSVFEETNKDNNVFTGPLVRLNTQNLLQPFYLTILWLLAAIFGAGSLFAAKVLSKKKIKPAIEKKKDKNSGWQQMVGKTMLLETDPKSDRQKVLSGFVSQAKKNDELLFIMTDENSTLNSKFSGDQNIRFLLLTSKSVLSPVKGKETYLTASDLSALLRACTEIKRIAAAETEKTVNLLFGNLSETIIKYGFERSYRLARLLLKELSSSKTRVLFLFNPTVHDQARSSSIRNLFHINLAFEESGEKV